MSTVGLKDLRQNMETYIRRIKKGSSFIVMKKSQAVFKISPLGQEENWEAVIDFTKIKKGGVDIDEVLSRL